MLNKKTTTELLAPAGTYESLVAAVQNGADAVYVGASEFSARASAGNFDRETLIKAVEYCHIRGVKIFAALNTLIKQSEFEKALELADFFYSIGIDALIIQDLGLSSYILAHFPQMHLHASTQMTVHSVAGAKKLEELGFKRVVLARELSYEQIKQIKEQTNLELEIFVHGAICCSYSGQCLFSSFLGGRSGNRGRCAQPCRLPYELEKDDVSVKKGYLLSPKDMCLLEHIGKIKDLGIDSLKIEGRLKKPEYVATVTRTYRKYIDNPVKPEKQDVERLLNAFNRSGFTDGYFTADTGKKMMSVNSPSNISEEIFEKDIKQSFAENANLRRVEVEGKCVIKPFKPSVFTLSDCDGNVVRAEGAVSEIAKTTPLSYDRVYAQLSKFGSVPFFLKNLDIDMDENCILPISELNALRRLACEKLVEMRKNSRRELEAACSMGYIFGKKPSSKTLNVSVCTLEQAQAVLELNPDVLYAPHYVITKIDTTKKYKTKIIEKTEAIINNDKENIVNEILTDSVLCSSLGAGNLFFGKHNVYGDYRLNIYNEASIAFYLNQGFERVTLSPELSIKDILKISKNALRMCDVVVYGHIPLMTMKNCIIKAYSGKCNKNSSDFVLVDRKKERMPVMCQSNSCTNILLNSKPIYMADKLNDLTDIGVEGFTLMFTIENPDVCARICKEYIDALGGNRVENSMGENNFTRAHFYRGVL